MKKHRRQFSAEFKQEAIDLVRRSGKGCNQIGKELGINQTSLSRWLRVAGSSPAARNVFASQEEYRVQMDTMKIAPGANQYTAVDDCSTFRALGIYPGRDANIPCFS